MLKLTPPKQTTLNYHITTPMFLGGANPKEVDEKQFRNASFKGALRFWWRATQWGTFLKNANGNSEQALKNLHAKEGELFGSASDSGGGSRQSQVQIQSVLIKKPGDEGRLKVQLESVGYFLGLGLYGFRNGVLRKYIKPTKLSILLEYSRHIEESDIVGIEHAAIALGLFGGLGSRARKGLGSISIQSMTSCQGDEQAFTTIEAIESFVNKLDFSAPKDAPFTAISQASRIVATGQYQDAMQALKTINDEMQLYRSWGKDGKVNGQDARRNFKHDHDLVQKSTTLRELPQRSVFGLPHNYFFSSTGKKMEIAPKVGGRRVSPLFIHVHALSNGKFTVIQTLLPALFLHGSTPVEGKSEKTSEINNTNVDYGVIHRYMDGFKTKEETKNHYKELRRHG